ncbi:MAG: serine dehydratase subunit alpha family protein [Deltaproteobacteria bacterium]|nr:serine dehydratase subunit alpha family protein [Deltaproteobacteria bacterium]
MRFADYLAQEWKPALGCTEPASIAYAASSAAALLSEPASALSLCCDPRIYKNCYAVGIPHSGHRVGIRWALAIGALLHDPSARLECFEQVTPRILEQAGRLVDQGEIDIEVDPAHEELFIDCRLRAGGHEARAVIRDEHTRLVQLELDGQPQPIEVPRGTAGQASVRAELARLRFEELIRLACSLAPPDREALRDGVELNLAIARHGLSLFPKRFVDMASEDPLTRISRQVCAGVYARMCGEDFSVMSLAGSGNKGIVCSVPMALFGRETGRSQEAIDEALALACLVISSTTHFLGTLSAVCGCSNAAGIGLAAGIVLLEGGGAPEISHAINNMVGNVTGMICDGAKIGCALKTMTSVDAAFRSASLAQSGIGIPHSDGIVGEDGLESLANLGRMATAGMASADAEILAIMQEKLRRV